MGDLVNDVARQEANDQARRADVAQRAEIDALKVRLSAVLNDGIGPDAPIEYNEYGAVQSATKYRFDALRPSAMFALARVMDYGAKKYPERENFYRISVNDHLNHALLHIYAYLNGDRSDDHLGHVMARAMGALAVAIEQNGYDARQADER